MEFAFSPDILEAGKLLQPVEISMHSDVMVKKVEYDVKLIIFKVQDLKNSGNLLPQFSKTKKILLFSFAFDIEITTTNVI